jgi:ribonucleotide monophosphatase NagD (HAD superfamily)
VCGGEGVVEALERRGVDVVFDGDADAVVVGWHRMFDYDGLTRAARAVQRGARLIGTNDDATYPTPDGPIPGGGSILAAVSTACGLTPVIAGKPYEPMAALVRAEVGADAALAAVMVGDRPSTDGLFARTVGCRYAHVWSGVTPREAEVSPTPDVSVADLSAVAELVTGGYFSG